MFSFESRRAQASISLDCETGLTSCIILTRKVFTADVLERKKKKIIQEERWISWMIDRGMKQRKFWHISVVFHNSLKSVKLLNFIYSL